MSYSDLSECTLDASERAAERDRIVSRLSSCQEELNRKELEFVTKMESCPYVSIKQLFYLRDINNKY